MWVIAGILLGLVVLASLVGFHTGPHTHLAAGVIGVMAAVVLILLAAGGASRLVWVLLAGDLTASAGVGFLAWRGLSKSSRRRAVSEHRVLAQGGAEGVALSDLDPEGLVRVHGEDWSAVAVNAPVRSGAAVQVVGRAGVHLQVWGEEAPPGLTELGARRAGEEK